MDTKNTDVFDKGTFLTLQPTFDNSQGFIIDQDRRIDNQLDDQEIQFTQNARNMQLYNQTPNNILRNTAENMRQPSESINKQYHFKTQRSSVKRNNSIEMQTQLNTTETMQTSNAEDISATEEIKEQQNEQLELLNDQKQQITKQKFKTFEDYRNNTSFFDLNKKWLERVHYHYEHSKVKKVLQRHQYEAVMYMAGEYMNEYSFKGGNVQNRIHPRGLLLFFYMGTGKSITNIASSLYCLSSLKIYSSKSKVVFICNKALQAQFQQEVLKYIQILNKEKLNELFRKTETPLNPQEFLNKFAFITFNDTFSLDDNLMEYIDVIQHSFLIFDEVHNLFKSIVNDSVRGNTVYQQLISNKLQIQFNSGTPFSNDLRELAVCFNILSGNPNLFPLDSMESLFSQTSPGFDENVYIKNKQVIMRRINGLVSSAEIDANNEHFPRMNSLQLVQIQIPKEYLEIYKNTRKQNLKTQKFMSESHLLDNAHISTEGVILSAKFQRIKEEIETHIEPQLLYSQYVKNGTILFINYCIQRNQESNITWKEFTIESYKRQDKEVVYALIHGQIPSEERTRIISIFNSPANVNGDIITLLCLSKASVEGINIKYIRKVHIMEAQWESRDLQQVMSRGQRMYSHSLLPIDQRFLTPFIYISYTSDPKFAFIKDIHNMSTDQQIYFKQQSLIQFQNTIFTLLHFASFNCFSLNQFSYLDQVFKPEFHKACFTCDSDNKQLFNPRFIHQDVMINNCRKPQVQTTIINFEHNNIEYGVQLDLYATFGFNIFELRDKYKKPIQSNIQGFPDLFEKAKSSINRKSLQNITIQQAVIQPNKSEFISILPPQIIFLKQKEDLDTLDISNTQKEDILQLYHQIVPSNQMFSYHTLLQFLKQTKYSFVQYTNNRSDSVIKYKFWDILPIFRDNLMSSISSQNTKKRVEKFLIEDFKKTTFFVNSISMNYIEFQNNIIRPFYKYLIANINVQARVSLERYFVNYKQLYLIQKLGELGELERHLLVEIVKQIIF